ncbi:restriction endonuclease subunit M [Enterococcus canis]|uniref:Restriction endonuclease subunit M n=2 Tax=Enterococcus canis TaxID=214095 RepID=A0A1L8RK70_9ENTE|nr:restriction endonuclease subunit M [Enterococcus canis]
MDRTTNRNIIWATNTYEKMGKGYRAADSITMKHVSGAQSTLIRPRIEKMKYEQKDRTKGKAEVFTPTWIVRLQNDVVDKEFQHLSLEEYVEKTWLEITCGEAPYMVSRYDAVTGQLISISERVGFVDRKLKIINEEIDDPSEWIRLVKKAYQASFGYEYQGDSLLIARENLLYTFIEYYQEKFQHLPDEELQEEIAKIISYNVFQMDGLRDIVPLSELNSNLEQLDLFSDFEEFKALDEPKGIPVKIKDWKTNRMIEFRSLKEEQR